MTDNACQPTPVLTPAQRAVWAVNNLVTMDRDDLATELADSRSVAEPEATISEPVRRGVLAAHRVVLRSAQRR